MAKFVIVLVLLCMVYSTIGLIKLHKHKVCPHSELNGWIRRINNNTKSTWKAGENFKSDLSTTYITALLGTLPPRDYINVPFKSAAEIKAKFVAERVPLSFDARQKWNQCKSLHLIRDQGECGSCWAVAAASVFGDRSCIRSKGEFNEIISAEEPLACCGNCGLGCEGGLVDQVWSFFLRNGVVTGGEYNSSEGCLPYSVEPCAHSAEGQSEGKLKLCNAEGPLITPSCQKSCTNRNYKVSFTKDHIKATTVYRLPQIPTIIQIDILSNGPVQAVFAVFEDFLTYKSGVYKRTLSPDNAFLGLHSVKIIGWGKENDVPYWLAMNSWNKHWGNKGTFKILRGSNECSFEEQLFAGFPSVSK